MGLSLNIVRGESNEKEMEFIAKNARKNETKGLSMEKVVNTIIKADAAKNPKLSYLVGKDAHFANLLSMLPQNIVNKIVRYGLAARMKKV